MSALDILAIAACDAVPLTTWEKRYNNLVKARAKMAEIRAKRKAAYHVPPKPKLKKAINPNWRSENIKKAHAALMKKRAHKKLMAQDTEPEDDPTEDFEGEDEEVTD
jgi:hypothetical protein